MLNLAEMLLKLHKDLPKAKTPHEQESLQRQIAATDRAIDALVYELYGLTKTKSGLWNETASDEPGVECPRIAHQAVIKSKNTAAI